MPVDSLFLLLFLFAIAAWCGLGYCYWQRGRHLRRETADRIKAEQQGLRVPELEQRLQEQQARLEALRADCARLQALLEAAEQNQKVWEQARRQLGDAFKAMSADALHSNNEQFLKLARSSLERYQSGAQQELQSRQEAINKLVQPVQESLEKFNVRVNDLEKAREGAYRELSERIRGLTEHSNRLQAETAQLSGALRSPVARGKWGEAQLKRILELSGMLEHCDFTVQKSVTATDGSQRRPDVLVLLPDGGRIAVDAKTPLDAYLCASKETDEARRLQYLDEHAQRVRETVRELSRKAYWEQIQPAPSLVLLYLPGESFYQAALQQDAGLLQSGVEQRVLLTGPTALLAVLSAVALAWREWRVQQNAQEISRLGAELYDRILKLNEHWSDTGKHLDRAVQSYNRSVASLERRVLVSARRFQQMGATSARQELTTPASLDTVPRDPQLTAPAGLAVDEADPATEDTQ